MNVCYLILTILLILFFMGFIFDMYLKYQSEINLKQFQIDECRREYIQNNCDRPTPWIMDKCKETELCMNQTATGNTTSSKVLIRLALETLNDFAENVQLKSLGVLTLVVLLLTVIGCICKIANSDILEKKMLGENNKKKKKKRKEISSSSSSSSTDEEIKKYKKMLKK